MGYIYKVTNNINGKMYIGKTEDINPIDRWDCHLRDYRKNRCEKRPFYNALNKYGVDNFTFEVIDSCDDSNDLCNKEKYYIEKYRTYVGFDDCNGYNATLGGDGKSYLQLDENDVVKAHIENDYIAGHTAKIFNVDPGTIKKILTKHNIKWLSAKEIVDK